MRARDIMTHDVLVAKPNDSVEEVARILLENKISGIPVVDADRKVLGIISEKDLIIKAGELKVPFYITLFDSIIFLENTMRFNNDLKKYTALKVKDAMTTKVVAVDEDEPVSNIVKLMQAKKVNRVPVLRHEKLVGIITRNDILKAMVPNNG
ncbi:cbs domain protein sometimes clustered with yjee [hydrocarbon metagenome]|uniref:Cbs domain protein sometimes clustered with yjee n=1 Tax=hydrocarbon metagenome TaxID=938273 RepID=A0A0W8E926_9ZZZZ